MMNLVVGLIAATSMPNNRQSWVRIQFPCRQMTMSMRGSCGEPSQAKVEESRSMPRFVVPRFPGGHSGVAMKSTSDTQEPANVTVRVGGVNR